MTDDIIEAAAKRLLMEQERLDPGPNELSWETLTEREREFYRLCVDAVLDEITHSIEADALERAAKVAEEFDVDHSHVVSDIVFAIRAIKEQPAESSAA